MTELKKTVADWRDFDFQNWFESLGDDQKFPALLREYERYADLVSVFDDDQPHETQAADALSTINAELMLVQAELLQIAIREPARSIDDIISKLSIWQLGSSINISRAARVTEGRLVLSALTDLKRLRAEVKMADVNLAAALTKWFDAQFAVKSAG